MSSQIPGGDNRIRGLDEKLLARVKLVILDCEVYEVRFMIIGSFEVQGNTLHYKQVLLNKRTYSKNFRL